MNRKLSNPWQIQLIGSRFVATCLIVVLASASCRAQLFYNFIDDSTGDALATLELAHLPAVVEDVRGLTFTPEGEAEFGLGPVYLGTMDDLTGGIPGSIIGVVVPDGMGGLRGQERTVWWGASNVPPYPTDPPYPDEFQIIVGHPSFFQSGIYIARTDPPAGIWYGAWRTTLAEPSGFAMTVVATLAVGAVLSRRMTRS